jgi:hypothetical protein
MASAPASSREALHPDRRIVIAGLAKSAGVSAGAACAVLSRATEAGLSWTAIDELDDATLLACRRLTPSGEFVIELLKRSTGARKAQVEVPSLDEANALLAESAG